MFLNPAILQDIPINEVTVPHLENSDIDSLLHVLDRENRLGALKGQPKTQQREAFRDYANRQLLVAMISATSGRRFEDKISEEFDQLENEAQLIYALVSLATTFRCTLRQQDILIALNDSTNEMLNKIQSLLKSSHPCRESTRLRAYPN